MKISYDPAKNQRNIAERALSFDLAAYFDFETSLITVDARKDYGETRYVAVGRMQQRLHVLCFTETEDGIRVISFRKANTREVKAYEKARVAHP